MGAPQQSVRVRMVVEQLDESGAYTGVDLFHYVKTITVEKHYHQNLKVADNTGTANFAADATMAPVLIGLKSQGLPVNFKFGGAAGSSDPNIEAMLMVCSTGEYVVASQPAIHLRNDAPDVTTPAGGNDAYVRAIVSGDEV